MWGGVLEVERVNEEDEGEGIWLMEIYMHIQKTEQ
jgi:hypothetical protein